MYHGRAETQSSRGPGRAGVWRAPFFMRAIMAAARETCRVVSLVGSFQGLPQPDPANFPMDAGR